MPTRLLKESICTSKDINKLTPEEEVFFYRLIVNCDDHGYFQADPGILRGRCFPRRIDLISDEIICQWLQALVINSLVTVFESGGSFYLYLPSWTAHQQVRAKRFKYPHCDANCRILQADEITCTQLLADDCKCARNPIQSNPIQTKALCHSHSDLLQLFGEEFAKRYPGIDIAHEFEKCWLHHEAKHKGADKNPNWKLRLIKWMDNVKKWNPPPPTPDPDAPREIRR